MRFHARRWSCWCGVVLLLVLVKSSSAFLATGPLFGDIRRSFSTRPLSSSSSADHQQPNSYPAQTRQEVEALLADIPIYAVTDSSTQDDEGGSIVLLKEPENDNSIAYFFMSPDTANSVFKPLRAKQDNNVTWDVTRYSLGLVWFELIEPGVVEGVEYRLVPESREVAAAQSLLQQSVEQHEQQETDDDIPKFFRSGYNEIPIFLDQSLRISNNDGDEKVPLYFGMQDLLDTCRQYAAMQQEQKESDGNAPLLEAAVTVAELFSLVSQMQQNDCGTDFSKAVFVPSSSTQSSNAG